MLKCKCPKPRHKGDYICILCGGKIPELYICKDHNNCGDLSKGCPHAKLHYPERCPDCGTGCWQSNAMCQGGACSQVKIPIERFIPSHCIPIEEPDLTDDPAPYCSHCGAQLKSSCTCGPIAGND